MSKHIGGYKFSHRINPIQNYKERSVDFIDGLSYSFHLGNDKNKNK